jgi:hypothetical protein
MLHFRTLTLPLTLMVFIAVKCPSIDAQASSETTPSTQSSWINTSIAMKREKIPVGQTPWLLLTVKNLTDQEMYKDDFLPHVDGKQGEATRTYYHRQLRLEPGVPSLALMGPPDARKIAPRGTAIRRFDLTDYYDLATPGEYSVYVEFRDSGKWRRTNTVQFTVTPDTEQPKTTFVIEVMRPFDKESMKVGSPIFLSGQVTNTSGHEIVVDSSVSKDDVEVRDAAGNLVPLTESGRRFREHLETGGKLQNPQHIKAGGHIGESFPDPRQLYDMSRPGEYSIQVSLYDDGTKIWVKSDTITVTVTP